MLYICTSTPFKAFTDELIFILFSFLSGNIWCNFMASVNSMTDSIKRDFSCRKESQVPKEMESEYSQRSKWIQAAALGPNDCLVSATSLMMGIGFLRRETKKIKRN